MVTAIEFDREAVGVSAKKDWEDADTTEYQSVSSLDALAARLGGEE